MLHARHVILLLGIVSGCQSPPQSSGTAAPPDVTAQPPSPAPTAAPSAGDSRADTAPFAGPAASNEDGLGKAPGATWSGSTPLNVDADASCPILYPPPDDEIAAQAQAIVPLKPGLTLSHVWRTIQSAEDIECLSHVVSVDAQSVRVSNACLENTEREDRSYPRRTCLADMRRARAYQTMVGSTTPETIVGATSFSLSREAFLELKRDGSTAHQYIELRYAADGPLSPRSVFQVRLEGTLTLEGRESMAVIVNDAITELPVLRLSGSLRGTWHDKPGAGRVTAAVVDDERFPLMLEYRLLDLGEHEFSVRYTKISYPGAIERRLDDSGRVDVYGIYFDFGSDRIRPESEPVLREIAGVLEKHAEWTLSIEGHTDNVGGDAANLDLSQRRSAAVRTALVQRYGIAADRLVTAGFGEAAPKDTNDTPEGRARNRRVELVRR